MTVASGLSQVGVAVAYVLAARAAGPSEFGQMTTALATSLAIAGLLDFGANSYWTRELAKSPARVPEFWIRATAKLLVVGATLAVAVVALLLAGAPSALLLAPLVAALTALVQTLSVLPRSDRRSERIAVASVAERVVALLAMIVLLQVGEDPLLALGVALSVGLGVGAICVSMFVPRHLRVELPRRPGLANPWEGAVHFGVANMASTVSGLDMLALQTAGGSAAAGVYGAVSRWTQPMGLVSTAVTAAAAPFFAASPTGRAAVRSFRGAAFLLSVNSLLCILLAAFADPLVGILLGAQYADSAGVLRVLAVAVMISSWNQPAAALLQARNRDRVVAVVRLIAAVIALAATVVLAASVGAIGAAFAVLGLQIAIGMSFALTFWRLARADRRSALSPDRAPSSASHSATGHMARRAQAPRGEVER